MNRSIQPAQEGQAVRIGLGLAAVTAVISGVSLFVNASAVRSFGDPALFTTLKNGVAAILLLALAVPFSRSAWRPARGHWRGLLAIGIVGGGIPFILFFTGLAAASAPGAAVIQKTLFAWVAILAIVFLRERLGGLQIAAVAVLLVSQLLIQPPGGVRWGSGETMILAATGLWAIEVVVAKRVLVGVPPLIAGVARMGIGLIVIVGYLWMTGGFAGMAHLGADQVAWVLLTGCLLTAYVASWYAALQRAPASAVTAILTLGLPITAGLQLVSNGQVPTPDAVVGYGAGLGAVALLGWLALRAPRTQRADASA